MGKLLRTVENKIPHWEFVCQQRKIASTTINCALMISFSFPQRSFFHLSHKIEIPRLKFNR